MPQARQIYNFFISLCFTKVVNSILIIFIISRLIFYNNKYICLFVFFAGWRESLNSMKKKWMSTSIDSDEYGFPEVSGQVQ